MTETESASQDQPSAARAEAWPSLISCLKSGANPPERLLDRISETPSERENLIVAIRKDRDRTILRAQLAAYLKASAETRMKDAEDTRDSMTFRIQVLAMLSVAVIAAIVVEIVFQKALGDIVLVVLAFALMFLGWLFWWRERVSVVYRADTQRAAERRRTADLIEATA